MEEEISEGVELRLPIPRWCVWLNRVAFRKERLSEHQHGVRHAPRRQDVLNRYLGMPRVFLFGV